MLVSKVKEHVKGGTRVTEGETIHAGRSMKENMGAKEVRSAVHIGRSTVKGSLQVFDEEKFELQLNFRCRSTYMYTSFVSTNDMVYLPQKGGYSVWIGQQKGRDTNPRRLRISRLICIKRGIQR
jgi:hypothetical protein